MKIIIFGDLHDFKNIKDKCNKPNIKKLEVKNKENKNPFGK
ncbi:hypothetical protein [Malaciobacter mytili]|nr:hypothetical protein [Malaciobacter mytili]